MVYDVCVKKKRKKTWGCLCNIYFFLRLTSLIFAVLVILFYRLKIMNFEGPTFTSIDNPAAYADSVFVRV